MATVKLYPSMITTVGTWTNPNNVKADDGAYAVTEGAKDTNVDIIGSGFTNNIPSGSTINSITFEVQYKLSKARSWVGSLIPVINGTEGDAITTTSEPTSDTIWQNTPNRQWIYSELNTLGILFRVFKDTVLSCSYSVDYLAIIVDYTETGENYSGTVSISSGDQVSTTGKKGIDTTLVISNGIQILVQGEKHEKSHDSTGIVEISHGIDFSITASTSRGLEVLISEGVRDSLTGTKPTRVSLFINTGDNTNLTGSKSVNASLEIQIGDKGNLNFIKAISTDIELSHGANIQISNDTTFNFTSSVTISGGYRDNLQGQKDTHIGLTSIAGSSNELSTSKAVNTEITLNNGVNINIKYQLPYTQLIAYLKFDDRETSLSHKELTVKNSYIDRYVTLKTESIQAILTKIEQTVTMEVEYVSLENNTVRLKAEFKDFDGELVSPTDVVLKIFDAKKVIIGEDIPVSPVDVGKYQHDYVLPTDTYGRIYYEFIGTLNNLPILGRGFVNITWI